MKPTRIFQSFAVPRASRWCAALVLCFSAYYANGQPAAFDAGKRACVERLITEAMQKQGIPGLSVAIAVKGEMVWSAGFGSADLENSVPAHSDTRYRTASISKWMTATAAMKLVEEGRLDLDAPVQKYCPAYPPQRWPIAVRYLLNHTAGIRHYYGDNDEPRETEEQRRRLDELMRQERLGQYLRYVNASDPVNSFKNDPLLSEPGTRFHYTSNGYRLLGCVLEGAAGESYRSLMKRAVFAAAEMRDTTDDDSWAIIPRRAAGYAYTEEGVLRRADFRDVSENLAAGGHLSTAPDLVRFAMAFNSGRLITLASSQRMVANPIPIASKPGVSYGFGIFIDAPKGKQMLSHSGGQAGVSTYLSLLPEQGFAVAIMMNREDGPATSLGTAIRAAVLEP